MKDAQSADENADENANVNADADAGTGDGECVSHCPQQIDIPAELHRLDVLVENLKRNGAVADKSL